MTRFMYEERTEEKGERERERRREKDWDELL